MAALYSDAKPGAIPNYAGQLFRFVHEMKPGDLVIYPSKRDRQVHLGRIEGGYEYDAKSEIGYRPVRSAAAAWFGVRPSAAPARAETSGVARSIQPVGVCRTFEVASEGQIAVPPAPTFAIRE